MEVNGNGFEQGGEMTEPYYQDNLITIYNKDCRDMSEMGDESVDLIVTDPPYGISFMGKDWDKALPSKQIWTECLRVLKNGAFAFVMCIPRADCLSRMIISLEDAGLAVNFTPIYWVYASGFPKAQNISLSIDKRECLKQLVEKLGRNPTKEEFDKAWKAFRTLVGKREGTYADIKRDTETGQDGLHGGIATNRPRVESFITAPSTPQAKALDGSYGGFQPKPAVEVIIVAMKPLSEKTFVDQALKNKKGITWLDEGRIPFQSETDMSSAEFHTVPIRHEPGDFTKVTERSGKFTPVSQGRFPANILVSDDVLNDGKVTQSGKDAIRRQEGMFVEHKLGGLNELQVYYADSGSFSRYFDLDKWFEEEIKQLPASVQKTFPFLIVPKASKSEKDRGLDDMPEVIKSGLPLRDGSGNYVENEYGDGSKSIRNTKTRNYHPTVKPLKLMSYLITLGSREGDVILDLFVGSGTTCLASKLLGRKSIGYDTSREYCGIAVNRCRQIVMNFEVE